MNTRVGCCAVVILSLLSLCFSGIWLPAAGARPQDEFRAPLSRSPYGYVRHWLLCGPFPTPNGGDPHAGLTRDYLWAQGGETGIHPAVGMSHTLPDGVRVAWRDFAADADCIDLRKAFPEMPEHAVGYAFTRLYRPTAITALLAVGSDDGVRVWLNGKLVLDHPAERKLKPDEDLVQISLKAGMNDLLVKANQLTGGWGFALRVLDSPRPIPPTRHANHKEWLTLALAYAGNVDDGELSVQPGCMRDKLRLPLPATVQVIAAGGLVMAEAQVRCGERAGFDVGDWPDGPYEVRCRVDVDENLRLYNHAMWYRGSALAEVKALVEAAPRDTPVREEEMGHRFLADYLKSRLGATLRTLPDDERQNVFCALMEYRELVLRMHGADGPDRPGGFVRLAYVDEIDGSTQFGRVFLPPNYDPQKKWPLVISLHGKNNDNPDYLHWGSKGGIINRFNSTADRYDAIVLCPHGRGNSFYQGIGEQDLLRCLEMAKQRFHIDDDRIYLTGYSMGGAGTWHVGTHYPELFAALAPYEGGREYRVTRDETNLAKLTQKQLYRVERTKSSFVNAESLLTTPALVNHGTADTTVQIGISRYGVSLMQSWGYDVTLWEHAGKKHGDVPLGTEDAVMEWLFKHRRVANPRVVRIRSGDLRTAAAHWVRIEQRENPAAFMRLEAEVVAPNTVRLHTDNVLQVTLTPAAPLIDPAKPLRVLWNDEELRVVEMAQGRATVLASGYHPTILFKKPGVDGPFSDLYNTPFAIVQGTTAADQEMQRAIVQTARDAVKRWKDDQHWTPRFFLDTEISEEDAARYSLLLIGGPEENLIARKLADRLPLQVTADAVTIDGQLFPAHDAAVQMLYPSPLHGGRYIAILTATSAAGMKHCTSLNSEVDFSIVDGRALPGLANGYFDRSWRLNEKYIERGTVKE